METYELREVNLDDRQKIENIIQNILEEYGFKQGSTKRDELVSKNFLQDYLDEKSSFLILENEDEILGGGVISDINDTTENICELKYLYLTAKERGKGLGSQIIKSCLNKAKELGYEKCYLETLPYMKEATRLYLKTGFRSLDAPILNRQYFNCEMWMIKNL